VLDLDKMNEEIYRDYGVLLFDSMKLEIELIYVKRKRKGSEEWEELNKMEYMDNEKKQIFISNEIEHDDEYIYDIYYRMNHVFIHNYCETNVCFVENENCKYRLDKDYYLCWDISKIDIYEMIGWRKKHNQYEFDKCIEKIKFQSYFYEEIYRYLYQNELYDKKYHFIHLRLEEDAIEHWRIQDIFDEDIQKGIIGHYEYSKEEYKRIVEDKYIYFIEKYIERDSIILLSGYCFKNRVYEYLIHHGYQIYIYEKDIKKGREINAIYDMILSESVSGKIIGSYVSTFTQMICIRNYISEQKILFLLNCIEREEFEYREVLEFNRIRYKNI
jgi:hypothetical protein